MGFDPLTTSLVLAMRVLAKMSKAMLNCSGLRIMEGQVGLENLLLLLFFSFLSFPLAKSLENVPLFDGSSSR